MPFSLSVPLAGRDVILILIRLLFSGSVKVDWLIKSAALKLITLSSFPDLSKLLTVGALLGTLMLTLAGVVA